MHLEVDCVVQELPEEWWKLCAEAVGYIKSWIRSCDSPLFSNNHRAKIRVALENATDEPVALKRWQPCFAADCYRQLSTAADLGKNTKAFLHSIYKSEDRCSSLTRLSQRCLKVPSRGHFMGVLHLWGGFFELCVLYIIYILLIPCCLCSLSP